MTEDDHQADLAERGEGPRRRGRLKIFLGAAPGVGKTYAMLEAARLRSAEGVHVLAAVIETHGRAETEALMRGLPVLPRRALYHHGRILSEMDLEALIEVAPDLALIDELAHANLPDSRHEKRWQDVEDVLAAGIDVYTTLNVQHIETLNDTVARITGIRVRETVPDRILETADEIALVDLSPEELLTRLRAGKVYIQDQAARAVQNFFSKGNLTALRELALRAAADRIDAELRAHMALNAIPGPWPAQERILVCLNEGAAARDAIRLAKRAADRARCEWIALTVVSSRTEALTEEAKDQLAAALRLAERLGAELATIEAEHDVAQEILDFARRRNARRIVLGRPQGLQRLRTPFRRDVVRDILRLGADFEISLTSAAEAPRRKSTRRRLSLPSLRQQSLWPYLMTTAATGLCTLIALAAPQVLPVASLSLIFMTGVIAVAATLGRGPAIAAAGLSFLSYNFLFTDPRFTFSVLREEDVVTLALFLVASVLTGNLAARLRNRILAQRAIVERTNKLYNFSRRVASAASFDDVVWAGVSHVASTLECQSILLAPGPSGDLQIAGGFPPEDRLSLRDMSAASYCWERGEPAGHGSATLPAAQWFFLPVRTAERRLAVIGISYEDQRPFSPVNRRLLEALVDQIALALERIRLSEDLEETRLASETERLRAALLSSVSHDLRTPLVSIIGAAGSLARPGSGLSEDDRILLAETALEEGERLDRYIQNLLDMTRLGHGALRPRLVQADLAELVGAARHRLRGPLRGHEIRTEIPDPMAPIRVDPVLTEQVIVNILDNAAKYAPEGSRITITARGEGARVHLAIADQGPGIPVALQRRVFDMFYRVENGDRQRAGTGLGLAICKGLVEAQGGTIRAETACADGTGTRITISLPIDNPEVAI